MIIPNKPSDHRSCGEVTSIIMQHDDAADKDDDQDVGAVSLPNTQEAKIR